MGVAQQSELPQGHAQTAYRHPASPSGPWNAVETRTYVFYSRRGLRGLPSFRIFIVLGGMQAAFVPSPSPGPWCARRIDSADVDSRVWLAPTRTYIAYAVPFMVWIHSRIGGLVE